MDLNLQVLLVGPKFSLSDVLCDFLFALVFKQREERERERERERKEREMCEPLTVSMRGSLLRFSLSSESGVCEEGTVNRDRGTEGKRKREERERERKGE